MLVLPVCLRFLVVERVVGAKGVGNRSGVSMDSIGDSSVGRTVLISFVGSLLVICSAFGVVLVLRFSGEKCLLFRPVILRFFSTG